MLDDNFDGRLRTFADMLTTRIAREKKGLESLEIADDTPAGASKYGEGLPLNSDVLLQIRAPIVQRIVVYESIQNSLYELFTELGEQQ